MANQHLLTTGLCLLAVCLLARQSCLVLGSWHEQIRYENNNLGQQQQQQQISSSKIHENELRKIINIGLILSPRLNDNNSSSTLEELVRQQLDKINQAQVGDTTSKGEDKQQPYLFQLLTANIVENPIEMSKIVCQQLIGNQLAGGVSAVIVDTDNNYIASIASISFTLGLYNIPLIGTTLRDSSLFNKNLHSSYISLISPYSHQADVWYNLMAKFQFRRAFVLTSAENRDLLSRFVHLIDYQHQRASGAANGKGEPPLEPGEHVTVSEQAAATTTDEESEFRIESIIEYDAGAFVSQQFAWQYIVKRLKNLLENSICRVLLIHAQSKNDVQFFLDIIHHLNMTKPGNDHGGPFALILSEDTVQVAQQNNITLPSGVIWSELSFNDHDDDDDNKDHLTVTGDGSRQAKKTTKESTLPISVAYALDALDIVVKSIQDTIKYQMMSSPQPTSAFSDVPNSCKQTPSIDWPTGIELYMAILRQTISGQTGYISFDENGDRLTANYNLLNLVDDHEEDTASSSTYTRRRTVRKIGTFRNGLSWSSGDDQVDSDQTNLIRTQVNISSIQWPGGIRGQLISGIFVNTHLRIITLQEKPFVWVTEDHDCNELAMINSTSTISIPCHRFNLSSQKEDKFCCKGYCMDLLWEISKRLNFTFELYLVPDNQYGSFEPDHLATGQRGALAVGGPPSASAADSGGEHLEQELLQLAKISSIFNDSKAANLLPLEEPQTAGSEAQSGRHNRHNHNHHHHHHQNEHSSAAQSAGDNSNTGSGPSGTIERPTNGPGDQLKWTGLIGELVARRADMAFAPLTITAQRALAIDFSKPFKFHGFSILLRRASKHTTLASFLQPFHNQLWILVIGVATHVVALSLYLLDRYSTFGQFGMKRNFIPKTPRNSHDDHPLHLSSSLWFSWSILLNSGVGEHTPKSLSGRVLGIFWSSFAMIVVASYTANLAAFLVLDSREETPTLSGIDDPRLRSGELAFNFATVKGSAVDAYLQSQVEYINLYRKMEEFNFNNVDESIMALRSGTIDALIWDSTRLEWEVATDERCSLGIAGELFGSSGYGIGLQKDSYWTKNTTTKLLELHESGFMIDLDKKWIAAGKSQASSAQRNEAKAHKLDNLSPGELLVDESQKQQITAGNCEKRNDDYPETLGIFNIAGVFILFACGLFTSFGLIVVERFAYKHRSALLEWQRNLWRRMRWRKKRGV